MSIHRLQAPRERPGLQTSARELQVSVFNSLGQILPERDVCASWRWVQRGDLQLVGNVVEEVVAVVDDVGLVHRENGAWLKLGKDSEVPMGEERRKSGNPRQMGTRQTLSLGVVVGAVVPGGWPERVIVHVEDHAIGGPVESALQVLR